jgi:micrococcal nuclease
MRRIALALMAALLVGPAWAAVPDGLILTETASIAAAVSGDTLRLGDGRELRLEGVEAPRPLPAVPEGQAADVNDGVEALGNAAQSALSDLTKGRTAALYAVRTTSDGHLVAHVVVDDVWVEAALLSRGLVRVHTEPGFDAGSAEMLRLEDEARDARLGIWTHPVFRVKIADTLWRWVGTYQVVKCRLAAVGSTPDGTLLSFLEEASDVLNVLVPTAALPRFRAAGIDFDALAGNRNLRVRGWIRWRDGPFMELDHPAQLEVPEG